jgi:hypothetical protein
MELYGYDIDGVCSKGIEKKTPCVIISGRTFAEYKNDKHCPELSDMYPVYIRGVGKFGDRIAAGNFKAMMINYLGVTEFYEDDIVQADIIKVNCNNCKVYIV